MSLTCPTMAMTDPERPADGHYYDLNYVPWYAKMPSAERLQYLDWRIAPLKAELAQCYASRAGALAAFTTGPAGISRPLRSLEALRRIELGSLEPLEPWQTYHGYLDTPRWKRKRLLKFVSVNGRCEYPGCQAMAENCHHLHYRTLGLEENGDLEALCRRHHEARHGLVRVPLEPLAGN